MLAQNPSQILKSENRGSIVTEKYNCLSVFNYLNFQDKSREAFHCLSVFNDETLAPKETVTYKSLQDEIIVLLPLVRTIELNTDKLSEIIDVNQLYFFSNKTNETFTITNPYEKDLVNFIQLRFNVRNSINHKIYFDIEKQNEIISLYENESFAISIGVFDARNESTHKLKNSRKGLFTFVLGGAFEFQNRLLENRDALKIWDIDHIEFEALSPMAIVLIIDIIQ